MNTLLGQTKSTNLYFIFSSYYFCKLKNCWNKILLIFIQFHFSYKGVYIVKFTWNPGCLIFRKGNQFGSSIISSFDFDGIIVKYGLDIKLSDVVVIGVIDPF
jgi:hypothetical protein